MVVRTLSCEGGLISHGGPGCAKISPVSGLVVSTTETSPSLAAIVAAVDTDLDDYRHQTSPEGMVTIVFTDLEASTEMLEELGEDRWLEVMLAHSKIIRDCAADHGGEVAESQGDGYMLTFASASGALAFSVALQRTLERYNADHSEQPLRVRVGMHTGNIFQSGDDVLGRAVVLAARITGRARGGEILVSEDCREYTRRAGRWSYTGPRELELKGLASAERVYALDWV
jgi:class 3 adenylate cyclase